MHQRGPHAQASDLSSSGALILPFGRIGRVRQVGPHLDGLSLKLVKLVTLGKLQNLLNLLNLLKPSVRVPPASPGAEARASG